MSDKDERIHELELKLARAEGERDEARRLPPITVAPYYPYWHWIPWQPQYPVWTNQVQTVWNDGPQISQSHGGPATVVYLTVGDSSS